MKFMSVDIDMVEVNEIVVVASSFYCFSFRKYWHATNLDNEIIVDIWIQKYNPKNTISLHYNLFASGSTWPTIELTEYSGYEGKKVTISKE